jgi:manganese efflux pump family protein
VSLDTGVKLALLVLSLGLDTFAVAVALGISGIGRRGRLRVGVSFALFEGLMPLVGFFLGAAISGAEAKFATVAGIVVLFGVGAWMIWESFFGDDDREPAVDSLRGIVLTSLSVSMDELAVGFSMGALGLPAGLAVALIAAQAFLITLLGTSLGNRIGKRVAERGETVAGVVLCGLALVLAVQQARGG